jgi:hypothetical protein
MSACPGVSAITVKAGQAIKTTVTWVNTGSQAYSFDVIVIMGDYDPATKKISGYVIGKALDQASSPGQLVTTTMTSPAIPSDAVRAEAYDLIVAICDWDDVNHQFINPPYAFCWNDRLITVTS